MIRMTDEFDDAVRVIRQRGVQPRHKPYGRKKANCTPEQWAAHLEWRSLYYDGHRKEWDMYRNRWLARKK
jgi:hypothetical protein